MHSTRNNIIPRAASLLLAALLCIGLLALPGCNRDDGAGKIINYPIDTPPQRLDPAVARSPEELLVLGNVMEGLLRQDARGRLWPGVAERWETSPDGRVLTFYLRDDNHWRLPDEPLIELENTQVTAEDFAFGLRRALSPAVNAPGAALLFPILNAEKVHAGELPESALGIRAIDKLTLEITLSAPLAQTEEKPGTAILHALARSVAMPCNRAFFEACGGRYGLEPKYLLCNGPFYLTRMDDALTRLKPNEGYRGDELALPATVNLWTQTDTRMRARLLGTEFDAAVVPSGLAAEAPEGAESHALRNATLALVFNCKSLEDVNVRVAMCAALAPGALGYDAFPGLLPAGAIAGERNYREAAGLPAGVKHDMERASSLAASAQERIALRLVCAPEHETLLRRALQAWQKAFRLGMEAQIEVLEPEELRERLEDGDFDVAVAQLSMESSLALEALQALAGGKSPARYQSAALETLLRGAAQTDDIAGACLQAEEHLLQNGVYYPLEARSSLLLLSGAIEGLEAAPAGDMIYFAGVRKWEK